MALNWHNIKIKKDTYKRLKQIKSLVEVENDVYFDSISDLIDYLIQNKRDVGFSIDKFKLI